MKRKEALFGFIAACALLSLSLQGCGTPNAEHQKQQQATPQACAFSEEYLASVDNSHFIPAADWKDKFPYQYETYLKNSDDSRNYPGASEDPEYTHKYPALKTIFQGIGYSKGYAEPRGHTHAIEDVIATPRAKGGANCLSCKSPQYIIDEREQGSAFYKKNFNEVAATYHEPISCYDCHGNTPGIINVQRTNIVSAMKDYGIEISPRILSCAQCHNEYYFDKTGAVKNPYKYGTDPDSILKFYNEENFVDFVNPNTGIGLIKAQHPDWEAFNNSPHYQQGLTCVDCHMEETPDGYHSHQWTTPFKSPTIVRERCLSCHTDMSADELINTVNTMQKKTEDRVRKISEDIEATTNVIAEIKGNLSKEQFDAIAAKYRDALFYWDYVLVTNGEGFHNPELTKDCLDKSEKILAECNDLIAQARK